MIKRGEVQLIGSDCHNMATRAPNMGQLTINNEQLTINNGRWAMGQGV
jgi:tyrosine-protein phosphatase YwqE